MAGAFFARIPPQDFCVFPSPFFLHRRTLRPQSVELVLQRRGRIGGESEMDASDRRAIPEDAVLRQPEDGRRFGHRPQACATPDAAVTGDAMFCQRGLCEQIVDSGGDYLFVVKDKCQVKKGDGPQHLAALTRPSPSCGGSACSSFRRAAPAGCLAYSTPAKPPLARRP